VLETNLRDIRVVEQTKDDRWQRVDSVLGVRRQHDDRNRMLNGITQRTFKSAVRPQDELLRPVVPAQ